MENEQRMRDLDRATLAPLVRRALDRDDAELLGWEYRALPSLLGAAALSQVFRLTGTAEVGGDTRPWSLVLKALARPPRPTTGWDREVAVFRSGLLDDLPLGLAAPRCYAIEELPGTIWLWEEDVATEGGRWSSERFGLAARHLGRFSGRSLVAGPLPRAPWLSRGVLRERVDRNAAFWTDPAAGNRALLERAYPGDLLARARRVWDERHALLDALDRLPQALCHGDADRRNLFSRRGADGAAETAAIDWAWLGVAELGADLSELVAASTLWFQSEPADLPALAEACLVGYAAGLADEGWAGDPRLVRVGFAVRTALSKGPCGPAPLMIRYAGQDSPSSTVDRGALADRMAAVQRFAFDELDAVRGDLAAI